ncbi:calcium-binding protein [Polaromonas sp. CT11-55]|uniref:calcium-binding protein n=1 Tax=Polaromonas sp. CT11-55 TaxID=3243045 RepID=UPI0039A496B8
MVQKTEPNGFVNWTDFQAAVAASNPNIPNLNQVAAGTTLYMPERFTDGSITYHYAGGISINNNATTGEYHMVVPNTDGTGGQTIYSRTYDGNGLGGEGYIVKQSTTNQAGITIFDYTGRQDSPTAEVKPVSITEQLNGVETSSFYGSDGTLTGRSKTLSDADGTPTSDSLANTLQGLRNAAGDLDDMLLDAAELRALSGSQAEGEAWGGARLLTLGNGALGDYFRHHQDVQTGTVIPLLLDDPQTQGLGLLGGFDLGNGANVLDGISSDASASWNYLNNSAGGIDYIDWGYDTSVVDYASYTYDTSAYSYSSYTYDSYDYSAYNYGSYDYGWSSWWPVALDMDGDGIELVTQEDSHAWYDVKGDGYRRNIGWVGSDDALLAIDENHDGKITDARELSFALWTADTSDTDLQALKTAFDTNHDQKLDARDARFADLRVWQDKNGDGVSDAGELKTLVEAGIKSIGLSVAQTDWSSGGNRVAGFATYEKTDGTRGWAADVGLGYDTQGWRASVESNLVRMTESGGLVYGIARNNALALDLGAQGLDAAIGGTGSDTLSAGSKMAVLLEGGAGDDKLTGGAGDDWLAGDIGSDTLSGGDGDDTLVIDAQDAQANLNGGAGFDMAVVAGTAAVSLDLGAAGIEAAVGGAGNDNLRTSGTGRVILAGGAGSDSLSGSAAGDLLYGGTGDDALKGGRGNDIYVFNRGDGADTITDAATGVTMVTNTTTSVEYFPTVVLEPWVLTINYPNQALLDQTLSSLTAAGIPYGSAAYAYVLNLSFRNGWQYATGSRTTSTTTTTPVEVEVDAGQDTLRFGAGIGREDLALTKNGADWIFSIANNGVASGDQITLKNQTNSKARIESVEFSDGQKYAMEDLVFGTAGADILSGTAAANVINGGAGGDTMRGGAGDDFYVVDSASDSVLENANEGTDSVLSSISYTLSANVENLTVTGAAALNGTGNTLNNVLIGNGAANVLDGGQGNDTLDGGGGADTLSGGAGDDRYRFSLGSGKDSIVETSGNDRIVFGKGISAAQITASMTNGQVTLSAALGDSVSFAAPAINSYAIEQFEFSDGSVKDAAWLNGLLNVAPTGANKTLTFNEDGSYAITATDLGFSDANPGDSLSAVRIDSLPGAGSLRLDGINVTTAQVVSAADLAAGRLVFSPAANANGNNYASLTFSVKDQFGAFDISPNTLSFNVTPVNDAPTGTATISGTPTQNQTLTATHTLADVDGLGVVSYQWMAGGVAIAGAVSSRWTLTQAQVGKAISVKASYIDLQGTAESVMSASTAAVANVNDAPTGTVSLLRGGTPLGDTTTVQQGDILSTVSTLADADGLGALSYQWQSSTDGLNWNTISGATSSSFSPASSLAGQRVRVAVRYTDGFGFVENLNSAATAAVNRMLGTAGADTLAGTAGVDRLEGLAGNDGYSVNNAGDAVVENPNEGIDSVTSSVAYILTANVENLALVGTAINGAGNALDNTLTGNGSNNVLVGGFGNDTLMGGAGDDLLDGATSDVVKVVQTASSATTYLTRYFNQGFGSGQAISEVVSTVDSIIRAGRLGENLQVQGTTAVDKVYVGAGTTVDATSLGGGSDEIYLTGRLQDYGLSTAGSTLVLTRTAGLAARQSELIKVAAGTGTLNDKLVFLDGAINTLDLKTAIASGAAPVLDATRRSNPADTGFVVASQGADTMMGGTGNDSYTADDAGDVIVENAAEGTDLVQSYIASYTLPANVENLDLAGAAAINGVGNGLNNSITGNSGNNILYGGFGNDTLMGGAGDDVLDGATGDVVKVVQTASSATSYLTRYLNQSPGGGQVIGEVVSTVDSIIRAGRLGENLQVQGTTAVDKVYVGAGTTVDALPLGGGIDEVYVTGRLQDYSLGTAGSTVSLMRTGGLAPGQKEMVKVTAGTGASNDKLIFLDGAISTLSLKTAIVNGTAPVLDTTQRSNPADASFAAQSQGVDTLIGGTGNDIFMVDDVGDLVQENAGEGSDSVQSYLANYTLGANVENLTLLGSLNANGTGNMLANVLSGNSGNNTLTGGAGGDSYLAYRGMGQDRIVENDTTPGTTDMLCFGAGIASNQLWFRHTGNDLEVSIIGTADKATVQNWYLGDAYHVEQIKSGDGKTLQHTNVDKLVSAMAAFAPPAMGQTSLTASQQTALAPVLAANWH